MAALHIYIFNTHFVPILVLNQQFIRVSVMLYTVQMVMVKTDENGLGGEGRRNAVSVSCAKIVKY